ncbi:S41 family peptidase [Tateyamaria sp. SN3-11]|uniref:S41 family peptidase n=1 Tax=Tateyamaria sp. SN3-11 TaxID=3092147 RepID=UPI0039EA1369
MDDADLFALMSRMITPLRDGHVGMFAEIDGNDRWFAPHRGRTNTHIRAQAEAAGKDPFVTLETFRQDLWFNSIANGILGGEGHLAGNQRVQYGMAADTVGYLALATLGGFGPQDANPHEQLAATQAILEEVMWYFKTAGAKTLILDLSLNLGGNDFTAREVASRFAVGPTHGYTKFASDAETPNDAHVVVLPSTGKRFSGEVYVLTSNVTISAGEILTLTLRAMPQVRHVGERSRGAFSSVLAKTLPNGWQLLLSNETYLDADGTHWEGRGIKPHLEMLVFSDLAPIESHAQTVEALISALD